MPAKTPLPVLSRRDHIVSTLLRHRRAIISAPPGSGKSTGIPSFFLDPACGITGDIVVLQPRRVAARALAAWCSRSLNEQPGGTYGYRVRFDSRTGPQTRVTFQTYGVFARHLLCAPRAPGTGLVILDEFHERTLEMDLVLAWMRTLQRDRSDAPALMVMSATLDGTSLSAYLDNAPVIDIPGRVFPVALSYQTPRPQESAPQQALRALQGVIKPDMDGSVLIFMPGTGEIRACADLAQPVCRRAAMPVLELHGSLSLDRQMAVLDECATRPCVVVATNVAETSLTIPGVTMVIDSGLERRAAYDPRRDRNTLYRTAVCAGSATQRAGRAGRVAPGRCVRLWPESAQGAMPLSYAPEIQRLELSAMALLAMGLREKTGITAHPATVLDWLSPPEEERWRAATQLLRDMGAIATEGGQFTPTTFGKELLAIPADPLPASILAVSRQHGIAHLSCAMIAIWENPVRSSSGSPVDVFEAGLELAAAPGAAGIAAEVRKSFDALHALCGRDEHTRDYAGMTPALRAELLRNTAHSWMIPLRRRIAVREMDATRYIFKDGSAATLLWPKGCPGSPPDALIVLTQTESTGPARMRRTDISQYLPLETTGVATLFASETLTRTTVTWDETRQCVTGEKHVTLGEMILARTPVSPDPSEVADLLTAKLVSREINLFTDNVSQLLFRIKCTASAFPEQNLPPMTGDDWNLLFHDAVSGMTSRKEVETIRLVDAILDYLGPTHASLLDRMVPVRMKLPSGRTGRITYFESAPPEISARIGDFIGMSGRFTVCNGRMEGVFDILAPNMRTVQKTRDLTGFWSTVYPQLKNELKRRYPRHPWPL